MATDISPENEQFVQYELEVGTYTGRAELLDEAVGLLKRRRELQRDIQAGIDSGPGVPAAELFSQLRQKANLLAAGCHERAKLLAAGDRGQFHFQIGSTRTRDFFSSTTTKAPAAKAASCLRSAAMTIGPICSGKTFLATYLQHARSRRMCQCQGRSKIKVVREHDISIRPCPLHNVSIVRSRIANRRPVSRGPTVGCQHGNPLHR